MVEEHRVLQLENQFNALHSNLVELTSMFKELGKDMHQLAVATAKMEQFTLTIQRVFVELEEVQDLLKDSVRENNVAHELFRASIMTVRQEASDKENSYLAKELEREREKSKAWVGDLIKAGITIVVSILLYHFGVSK